jgi:phage-related protein
VFVCGTLLASGGIPRGLRAQEAQSTSRSDISTFDVFLDAHADIDAQLRDNPSLLTNAEFLESHPQLETFLNEHPSVQTQLKENPSYFMEREKRFDARENRRAANPNPDLNRQEVVTMDQFLDKNPGIERELWRNPSLVNNAEYLAAHPQLQAFLSQHPNVKEEIAENPRYFMQRENRFEAQENRRTSPNPDLTNQEVATMDQFLDKNPNIEQDLRRNASLVNDANYLQAHPQLQAFLNQHPGVKEEIAENPRFFMNMENRFESRENRRNGNISPNPDLTNQEVATMDQFLDKNPNIEQDLRRNASLVNDTSYLQAHPQLQAFLKQHPGVKEEIAENPRFFMNMENRFDRDEATRRDRDRDLDRDRDANARSDRDLDRDRQPDADRDADRNRDMDRSRDADRDRDASSRDNNRRANPNPDLTNQEVATMDGFLDRHQDVAKSLEKKPELINDRGYLKRHKDLDEFLSEHPAVREEVRENPSYFVHRENQFEARNMERDVPDRDRDRASRDRDRETRDIDNDLSKKELQDMDRFLDKHKKIEKDLQRNPSLANDRDYLKHHKSLTAFLSKNPQVGEELRENPSRFMRQEERLEARNHRMNQPATKPKTKVEEKEQMHSATPH